MKLLNFYLFLALIIVVAIGTDDSETLETLDNELIKAAAHGHTSKVRELLEKFDGKYIEYAVHKSKHHNLETALINAIEFEKGFPDVVKLLLEQPATPEDMAKFITKRRGWANPIYLAAGKPTTEILKMLFEAFPEEYHDLKITSITYDDMTFDGSTLYHGMTRLGNRPAITSVEMVQLILDQFHPDDEEKKLDFIMKKTMTSVHFMDDSPSEMIQIMELLSRQFRDRNKWIEYIMKQDHNGETILHSSNTKSLVEYALNQFHLPKDQNKLMKFVMTVDKHGETCLYDSYDMKIIQLFLDVFKNNNDELVKFLTNKCKENFTVIERKSGYGEEYNRTHIVPMLQKVLDSALTKKENDDENKKSLHNLEIVLRSYRKEKLESIFNHFFTSRSGQIKILMLKFILHDYDPEMHVVSRILTDDEGSKLWYYNKLWGKQVFVNDYKTLEN